jgi:hypothetical protein
VHTNITGAEANAKDAVAGLRAIKGLRFKAMLSKTGRAIGADRGPPKSSVCPKLQEP